MVMYDNPDTSSKLLVAKSQIAPNDLSIPHKELVAAHLLTKLMRPVQETLQKVHEISECHGWADVKEYSPHL